MKPKTWQDIEEAALNDPFLYKAVTLVRRGDLSETQALIEIALALAKVRQEQHDKIVELISQMPIPPERMAAFAEYLKK